MSGVWWLDAVTLRLSPDPLPLDLARPQAIAAHWSDAVAANPALWDGEVLLLSHWAIDGARLIGTCHRTRYRTALWLRAHWTPGLGTWNAFGSALLVAADGAVLLGEMAGHTANAGRVYCPGGILDGADITGAKVDTDHCVRRELAEETGLGPADAAMRDGWLIAHTGRALSLARVFDLPEDAEAARTRICARVQRQETPELADIRIVRSAEAARALSVPAFTQLKVERILGP